MEVSENYVRQSKTQNKPAGSIVGLRVPPHSNDAEMGVLGGMLLDRNAISKVVGVLEPASFYGENNRIIFETILSMYDNQISVDAITLGNELQKKNMLETVGGTKYIAELVMNTPSAANTVLFANSD